MPWNRPLIILLLVVLLGLAWWRLQPGEQEVRRTRLMMGTVVEIVAAGADPDRLEVAVEAAFDDMERLEKQLSSHVRGSDIDRLSRSEMGVEVASETAEVIALGLEVARRSNGRFDLGLGRLKDLWGFDSDDTGPHVPDRDLIAEALAEAGTDVIEVDGNWVSKRAPQAKVDLGGVAKGYIVDSAVKILRGRGVTSAAINAGGDMYLLGRRPQRPWRIGIQHPRQKGAVLATVEVQDRAVVTSGDYERFFEQEGVRYHHIFDPRSGLPARLCQSVTVITDNVALGDALATAVFVAGPEEGLRLLAGYPGAEGLIVAADGSLHASPGWAGYLVAP